MELHLGYLGRIGNLPVQVFLSGFKSLKLIANQPWVTIAFCNELETALDGTVDLVEVFVNLALY